VPIDDCGHTGDAPRSDRQDDKPDDKPGAAIKRTDADGPVHRFQTVIADLATIAKNRIQPSVPGAESFEKMAWFNRGLPLVTVCGC